MNQVVQTPEGTGVVKEARHTPRGGTEYLVSGYGGVFEGWYRQAELEGIADDYDETDPLNRSAAMEDMDGGDYKCPSCHSSDVSQSDAEFEVDMAHCDACPWQGETFELLSDEQSYEYPDDGSWEMRHGSHRKASWADVRQKASRLRSSGQVSIDSFHPASVHATVQGDSGVYSTSVFRIGSKGGTSTKVSGWSCDCEWGQWAYERDQSSRYLGRMCAHALAVYWEMQAQKTASSEEQVDIEDPADYMVVNQESTDVDNVSEKWHEYDKHTAARYDNEDEDEEGDIPQEQWEVTTPSDVYLTEEDLDRYHQDLDAMSSVEDEFGDHDWKPVDIDKDATEEAETRTYGDDDSDLEALSEPSSSKDVVASFQAEMGGTGFLDGQGGSDLDFAAAAEAHLAKMAGRYYTPQEQDELINEAGFSEEAIAKLNLDNSSYLLP